MSPLDREDAHVVAASLAGEQDSRKPEAERRVVDPLVLLGLERPEGLSARSVDSRPSTKTAIESTGRPRSTSAAQPEKTNASPRRSASTMPWIASGSRRSVVPVRAPKRSPSRSQGGAAGSIRSSAPSAPTARTSTSLSPGLERVLRDEDGQARAPRRSRRSASSRRRAVHGDGEIRARVAAGDPPGDPGRRERRLPGRTRRGARGRRARRSARPPADVEIGRAAGRPGRSCGPNR